MNCLYRGHNGTNKFHIVPKSKGGQGKKNTTQVCVECHRRYHALFGLLKPTEVLAYLTDYLWGGRIEFVEEFIRGRGA